MKVRFMDSEEKKDLSQQCLAFLPCTHPLYSYTSPWQNVATSGGKKAEQPSGGVVGRVNRDSIRVCMVESLDLLGSTGET